MHIVIIYYNYITMISTSQYLIFFLLWPVLICLGELRINNNPSQQYLNQQNSQYLNRNDEIKSDIIGYDCAKPSEVTTVSLIDIGECDIKPETVNVTHPEIRLLQRLDYQTVEIFQCKVIIDRHVKYCGWAYYIYSVENGDMTYMYDISREDCMKLQRQKSFRLVHRVKPISINNGTYINKVTFAGRYDEGDYCYGTSFEDEFGYWESNVVVDGTVTVTLRNMRVDVQLSTQQIILPSGQHCDFKTGYCMDSFYGHTYWDTVTERDDDCKKLGILKRGKVNKIVGPSKTVYTFVDKDVSFALEVTKKSYACHTMLMETLHPRLLIWEDDGSGNLDKRIGQTQDNIANLDLMSYVNAKFLYLDYNLKKTTTALYNDIIQKQCELEKEVLQNTLMLALQFPDHFAMQLKKQRGYLGTVSGEVVHISRCAAVQVNTRDTNKCYTELPVTYNDQPYFLSPITHILKTVGTQVSCSDVLATMYQLNKQWYKINPKPTNLWGGGPTVLEPLAKMTWKYQKPMHIGSSGIYSNHDLEKLRDRIMHGVEESPILSDVAKDIKSGGISYGDSRPNYRKLLADPHKQESEFQLIWGKFINFLMTLGSFFACLYGLFIVCQIIKAFIGLIVRTFGLDTVGGSTAHIFKTVGRTIVYFGSNLLSGPSMFDKQEQEKQEIEMIRKRRKSESDKSNDDSSNTSDEDVQIKPQPLHKKPIKHHQLTNDKNSTVEIHKMKATPKDDD